MEKYKPLAWLLSNVIKREKNTFPHLVSRVENMIIIPIYTDQYTYKIGKYDVQMKRNNSQSYVCHFQSQQLLRLFIYFVPLMTYHVIPISIQKWKAVALLGWKGTLLYYFCCF